VLSHMRKSDKTLVYYLIGGGGHNSNNNERKNKALKFMEMKTNEPREQAVPSRTIWQQNNSKMHAHKKETKARSL